MTLRIQKSILAILLSGVAVGFVINLWQAEQLVASLNRYAAQGWAVDAPVYYPAGYHLLSLPLLLSVIFGKRFYVAVILSFVYQGIHLLAIYRSLDRCFLEGNNCPPESVVEELVGTLTWFEWSASIIVPVVLVWLVHLVVSVTVKRRLA